MDGKREGRGIAWTAKGLRTAIDNAVTVLGRGGTTPHHIRRWKALLPLAEASDVRRAGLRARLRLDERQAARREAEVARISAIATLSALVATTPEGLAAKARWIDSSNWFDMPTSWTTLLQSAAAVAGVTLRTSSFDCAEWVRAFEAAGGTCRRQGDYGEWHLSTPHSRPAGWQLAKGEADEVLSISRHGHGNEIRRWLDANRPAVEA